MANTRVSVMFSCTGDLLISRYSRNSRRAFLHSLPRTLDIANALRENMKTIESFQLSCSKSERPRYSQGLDKIVKGIGTNLGIGILEPIGIQ